MVNIYYLCNDTGNVLCCDCAENKIKSWLAAGKHIDLSADQPDKTKHLKCSECFSIVDTIQSAVKCEHCKCTYFHMEWHMQRFYDINSANLTIDTIPDVKFIGPRIVCSTCNTIADHLVYDPENHCIKVIETSDAYA